MFSEGCVLSLDPGTKELFSNDFAVILGQCAPKVGGQDVLVELLVEAGEVFSMDKDLQGSRGDRAEQGGSLRMRAGRRRGTGQRHTCHLCLVMAFSKVLLVVLSVGSTWFGTLVQSLRRAQAGCPPPPPSSLLSPEPFPATTPFTHSHTRQSPGTFPAWPRTHPLEQFALQEGLDHVVGCGEVPWLVDEVDGFEPGWEGILQGQTAPHHMPHDLRGSHSLSHCLSP